MPFDPVADRYDETRGGESRGREFADQVEPWLAPGRTLEIGVGTGVVAAALRGRGHDVLGVDLSPAMLAHAYPRMGPRIAVGDARRLPVRDACCDNAFFSGALHAIRDVPRALAEAARVVRPGGRIVVIAGTAEGRDPDREVAPLLAALPPFDRGDNPDAVAAAGTAAGLRIVESRDLMSHSRGDSPNALADLIEQRTWSNLWHVEGAAWAEVVVPVIERLRALPDPDDPRDRPMPYHLSVFAR